MPCIQFRLVNTTSEEEQLGVVNYRKEETLREEGYEHFKAYPHYLEILKEYKLPVPP